MASKMQLTKQYKIFKMKSKIRKTNQILWIFNYLIPFFHLICIILFMLLNIQAQIAVSFDYVSQVMVSVSQNYLTMKMANLFFIIGIVISVTIIVLQFIRIKVESNYDEVTKNKKAQKFLFIASLILGYLYEIGIPFFAWSFSEIYLQEGLIIAFLKCLIPLTGYAYFSGKYSNDSLYGWFTVPVVVLITTVDNPVSYIIIIIISLYLIMAEKNIIKKVFYSFVALVALFVMKNSDIFEQSGSSQMQISFMCLGILVVLMPIFIIHIKEKLDLSNSEEKIQNCFYAIIQLKTDSPHTEIKFNEFYQLYNKVISFSLSNKDEKSDEIDPILEKDPERITKQDLLFLMEKFLQKECINASESNILKQILLFKIRAELGHPPHSIIEDLFSLNEEIQRSNKKAHQQKVFEIFEEIIQKFGIYKNGELEPAYLMHLNQLHEDFESKIHAMLDLFSNFWKDISEQEIKLISLDNCFQQVLDIKEEVEQLYFNIEKFGSFDREKKIIKITRSLYNVNEEINKFSRDRKRSSESLEKDTTHSFVVLENDIIKFISKDLLKSLGEKGSLVYENVDKKALFGNDFTEIIDSLLKNMNATSQNQWVTVPILTKEGLMQLKKIRIIWYPSLQAKCRTLIQFSEDLEMSHECFLIYHCKTDTIRYFNAKLISSFSIDQERFLYRLTNESMFFNQLFIQTDIPVQDIKDYLKGENIIKCKIYLKNYVEKGVPPAMPVELNVLRRIEINGEPTHCILKVTKLKDKKQVNNSPITQTNTTTTDHNAFYHQKKIVSSTQSALAKKYEHETFFCRIPNSYESKISEKQAQLQEQNRWVYRYFINVLFFLMFCTVLVLWIMDSQFLLERINSYKEEMLAIENTSEQYTMMYQAYSCATKRYYITKYPGQTQLAKGISAAIASNNFKINQQNFLDQFLQRYMSQINSQPNTNINYNISFEYFSINTSTDLSTLIDFAQNLRRNIATSEMSFLLKNYDNFRDLTLKFQSSILIEETIIKIVESYTVYFWVLVATVTTSLIAIMLILNKIQNTIRVVYSLIQRIPTTQLKDNLTTFQINKKRILQIFFLSSFEILKKKALFANANTMSSNHSNTSLNTNDFTDDLQYFLNNQNSLQSSRISKQSEITNKIDKNQNSQQEPLLSEDSKNTDQSVKQTHRQIRQSLIVKIYRKAFFIVLLVCFNAMFYLNYTELMKQRDGMIQVFGIKKNLYISLLHNKREANDAPIRGTMQDYYNTTIPEKYHTSNVELVSALPRQMILTQMKDFAKKAQQAMASDMCKYVGKYAGTAAKPCQTYLKGMVTKGYRQSIDIYLENARILSKQSMSEFGLYKCTVEACPPYFEHEFATIMIGETIRYMINLFNEATNQAFQTMQSNAKQQTALKVVGLIIVAILYLWFDNSLKKRCRKTIKYFRIIPKKIMCTMKMTTYIRKNNILDQLQIL